MDEKQSKLVTTSGDKIKQRNHFSLKYNFETVCIQKPQLKYFQPEDPGWSLNKLTL